MTQLLEHTFIPVCAQVSQAPAGSPMVISFCEWNRHYRWAKKKRLSYFLNEQLPNPRIGLLGFAAAWLISLQEWIKGKNCWRLRWSPEEVISDETEVCLVLPNPLSHNSYHEYSVSYMRRLRFYESQVGRIDINTPCGVLNSCDKSMKTMVIERIKWNINWF